MSVDCLISFHSKGFPLEKAVKYSQLRNCFVLNNLSMQVSVSTFRECMAYRLITFVFSQYDIQDRRKVYSILENEGIEIPRYAVLDRESGGWC